MFGPYTSTEIFQFDIAIMSAQIDDIREMGFDAPSVPNTIKRGFLCGEFSLGFIDRAEEYNMALNTFWSENELTLAAQNLLEAVLDKLDAMLFQAKREKSNRHFNEHREIDYSWMND